MDYRIKQDNFPYKKETDLIINAAIEVHKDLGCGFLEIVYKDVLLSNWKAEAIIMNEKSFILFTTKIFYCHTGFIIFDSVILKSKPKNGIINEDLAQTIDDLKCSDCKIGLVLNFGKPTL